MKSFQKCIARACCLMALIPASAALAAGGGVKGAIADTSAEPLAKVMVTLRAADIEKSVKTNKRGEFKISVPEAGLYTIRVEKEGYVTQEEPLEIPEGKLLEVTWTLFTEEEAAQRGERLLALQAKDEATKAYNLGADAYNEKNIEAAIGHFRAAIEVNPELELAHAALGRVLLETQRYEEAEVAARALLELRPGEPAGLQTLYDSLSPRPDKKDEAAAVLERLIEAEPGRPAAARVFNLAVAATKVHDYEAAALGFNRALELDPTLYQALLPLAQITFAKQDWQVAIDKAEAFLSQAPAEDPGRARANVVRYESFKKLGQTEAAQAAFEEIKGGSARAAAEMFLRDGIGSFNDGDSAAAITAIETAVELDPGFADAHFQLGLCYASAEQNEQARVAFAKFLELAPDHPEAGTAKTMLGSLEKYSE